MDKEPDDCVIRGLSERAPRSETAVAQLGRMMNEKSRGLLIPSRKEECRSESVFEPADWFNVHLGLSPAVIAVPLHPLNLGPTVRASHACTSGQLPGVGANRVSIQLSTVDTDGASMRGIIAISAASASGYRASRRLRHHSQMSRKMWPAYEKG